MKDHVRETIKQAIREQDAELSKAAFARLNGETYSPVRAPPGPISAEFEFRRRGQEPWRNTFDGDTMDQVDVACAWAVSHGWVAGAIRIYSVEGPRLRRRVDIENASKGIFSVSVEMATEDAKMFFPDITPLRDSIPRAKRKPT